MHARKRGTARLALVFLSLATVVGGGTVFGAVNRVDLSPRGGSIDKLPIATYSVDEQRDRFHQPADCGNLSAAFLDSACQTEHRKRHAGRSTHQVATVLIGRADARTAEP